MADKWTDHKWKKAWFVSILTHDYPYGRIEYSMYLTGFYSNPYETEEEAVKERDRIRNFRQDMNPDNIQAVSVYIKPDQAQYIEI